MMSVQRLTQTGLALHLGRSKPCLRADRVLGTVRDNSEWIFKGKLNGWMRDPDSWPEELNNLIQFL